nr:proteoglycan 4-like [Penaeus vannamei]
MKPHPTCMKHPPNRPQPPVACMKCLRNHQATPTELPPTQPSFMKPHQNLPQLLAACMKPPLSQPAPPTFCEAPAPTSVYGAPSEPAPAPTSLYEAPAPTSVYEAPSESAPAPTNVYEAPAPTNLYEPPSEPTPTSLYEAPSEPAPAPTSLYEAPAKSAPAPTNLYEAPSKPSGLYEVPPSANAPVPSVAKPMKGMPYNFQWGVEDADSGNVFAHHEDSDGSSTRGQYRVNLPDGRVQVVTFYDNGEGFHANVSYE